MTKKRSPQANPSRWRIPGRQVSVGPHADSSPVTRSGFGPYAAVSVVVANMIGTGVFTSLGFQLVDIRSGFALLLLWLVGGLAALSGALAYAELGAAIPRSGGEYVFLSRTYHPAVGFVSGCVSATVGFAAPTALAAITFGSYLASVFPALSQTWLALGLVAAMAVVHCVSHRSSSMTQSSFTTVKVALIAAFCLAAAVFADPAQPVALAPAAGDAGVVFGGAFAVSLIYVSYAYTGWNAATYLTGELDDPTRNVPRVLATGTLIVTALYLALNWSFLRAAPMDALVGRVEVGHVAATHLFGSAGGAVMGITLALLLVSTVSAMVLAGPRVLQAMGRDYALLSRLGRTKENGIPATAIIFQCALSFGFVVTASFEAILVFTGFTLGLNSLLAVAGVIVLRLREPDLERPYRTWGYPATPLAFVGVTTWTLLYIGLERPQEALAALGIAGAGLILYRVAGRSEYPAWARPRRPAR